MAIDVTRARALAESYLIDSAAIYRPDYAGAAAAALLGYVNCRLETYPSGGTNMLDTTGSATHLLRTPFGTDVRAGDEVLLGTARYHILATNAGRSLAYDTQAACVRQG
jgi:hypothetical protein